MELDIDALARRVADQVLDECAFEFDGYDVSLRELAHRIRDGDLIPVVRCKDCRWYDNGSNESDAWMYCTLERINTYNEFYCAHGEKRSDA